MTVQDFANKLLALGPDKKILAYTFCDGLDCSITSEGNTHTEGIHTDGADYLSDLEPYYNKELDAVII